MPFINVKTNVSLDDTAKNTISASVVTVICKFTRLLTVYKMQVFRLAYHCLCQPSQSILRFYLLFRANTMHSSPVAAAFSLRSSHKGPYGSQRPYKGHKGCGSDFDSSLTAAGAHRTSTCFPLSSSITSENILYL